MQKILIVFVGLFGTFNLEIHIPLVLNPHFLGSICPVLSE